MSFLSLPILYTIRARDLMCARHNGRNEVRPRGTRNEHIFHLCEVSSEGFFPPMLLAATSIYKKSLNRIRPLRYIPIQGMGMCLLWLHHAAKKIPASGESTIIITENVNDSIETRVALCSEGNISCRSASVLA